MRAYLAPFYRVLAPMSPVDVDVLTPSQIASVLGWDEEAAIKAVPMTDEEAAGPVRVRPTIPNAEQRLRVVM